MSRTAPTPGFIELPGYCNAVAEGRTAIAFPAIDFVPPGLSQDPEQQSVCFFMTKFVQEDRQEEIWGGSLEVLPSIYNKSDANSALSLATTATAMSSVSWNPECAHFKSVSLSKYVKSLKALNDIIQDPEESKTDNVLMAVLMLGFYEVGFLFPPCERLPLKRVANQHAEYQRLNPTEVCTRGTYEGGGSSHQSQVSAIISL